MVIAGLRTRVVTWVSQQHLIHAKPMEYLDTAANKKYLSAESSPVVLEVKSGVNAVAVGLGAGLGSLAGVLIALWRTKQLTFGAAK